MWEAPTEGIRGLEVWEWEAQQALYLVREHREDLWDCDEEDDRRPESLERCVHARSRVQQVSRLLESGEREPIDMAAKERMPLFSGEESNRGELRNFRGKETRAEHSRRETRSALWWLTMATRPCLTSTWRRKLTRPTDMLLVTPIGSKNPNGAETPAMDLTSAEDPTSMAMVMTASAQGSVGNRKSPHPCLLLVLSL